MRNLNRKFGSGFSEGEWNEQIKSEIFKRLTEHHTKTSHLKYLLPIPKKDRNVLKKEMRSRVVEARGIHEALALFHEMVEGNHVDC